MTLEKPSNINPRKIEIGLESIRKEGKKIKKLFGQSMEISKIDAGDQIPVGGKSFLSDGTDIKVIADLEVFDEFFSKMHEDLAKLDLSKIKDWLKHNNIDDIDERLFAILYVFNKHYEQKYPRSPKGDEERKSLYRKEKETKLSDILNANCAACAEIAILAQYYLQQEGIHSTYFIGEVLWDKKLEFASPHSFIVIRHNDKTFIYDPANPVRFKNGKVLPSIYITEANFDEEVNKGVKRYVTARHILIEKEACFGVGNQTNIREKDIV